MSENFIRLNAYTVHAEFTKYWIFGSLIDDHELKETIYDPFEVYQWIEENLSSPARQICKRFQRENRIGFKL